MLRERKADAPFAYLVTPNADHLVRLAREPDRYGPLYRGAAWRLLDSRLVAKLARILGLPVPAVTPGSDLTRLLLERGLGRGERLAVLGCNEATIEALRSRYALGEVVHHNPPMGFDRDPVAFEKALEVLEGAQARFMLLCVGSPRQELVAASLASRGRARGTALCVGASLLFLSGEERRAPRAMQRAGLEWAWRLLQDPRRLARRYLVDDPQILALLWRERRARAEVRG